MSAQIRTLLVLGATGNSGRRCMAYALNSKAWRVVALVRNPAKVAEVLGEDLAKSVTIIKGDLNDEQAVAAAVKTAKPDAIIEASSALPFGHKAGQPANNADRGKILRAAVAALQADARLSRCYVVIVGGQLLPEPGGTINSWFVWSLACLLKNVFIRGMWAEAERMIEWLWATPAEFRFTMARMGQMVDEPSRGVLQAEPTTDNIQHGSVSFTDVGAALVELAGDSSGKWSRKALFFNYAK